MTRRRGLIFAVGLVLLAGGLFALCFPVLLGTYDRWGIQLNCGTGYQTNLLQAELADDGGMPPSAPSAGYRTHCQSALAQRRVWAGTLAGVGAVMALTGRTRADRRSQVGGTARPSVRSELVAAVAYLTCRPWAAFIPANRFGVALIRVNFRLLCLYSRPVRGCRVEAVREAVRGEWVRAPGVDEGAGTVLLLHGSGYIGCSPRTHRGFASQISRYSGLPVFVLRYRLAPKHPFPAADDDAFAAYRWLLDHGFDAARIAVVGDSAGGHLAIAVAARARMEDLPTPAALTLFGPLIDPSFRTAMADARTQYSPIDPDVARRFLALYIGDHSTDDPRLNLLNTAAAGLPPIQLHYGTLEVMRAEAEQFAARLTQAGGSCQQCIWPNLVHGYWLFPRLVPEAAQSLRIAGQFIHDTIRRPKNASELRVQTMSDVASGQSASVSASKPDSLRLPFGGAEC